MQINRPSELKRLRIALIIGAVLIVVFMTADLMLLPSTMYELYIFDRLLLQLPIVFAVVVASSAMRTVLLDSSSKDSTAPWPNAE